MLIIQYSLKWLQLHTERAQKLERNETSLCCCRLLTHSPLCLLVCNIINLRICSDAVCVCCSEDVQPVVSLSLSLSLPPPLLHHFSAFLPTRGRDPVTEPLLSLLAPFSSVTLTLFTLDSEQGHAGCWLAAGWLAAVVSQWEKTGVWHPHTRPCSFLN